MAETVEFLTQRGIPVCAHIGLTPNPCISWVATRFRARTDYQAKQLLDDAVALENAGAACC